MNGPRRTAALTSAVQLLVLQLLVFAALVGVIEVVLVIDIPGAPTWVLLLLPLVGEIYVVAGAIAWARRPSNHMGALLVLGGITWLLAALANTGFVALVAIGMVFATAPLAVIVHMLLAFPSGRLRDRTSLVVTAVGYFTALVLQVPLYAFATESPPYDALVIAERPDLVDIGTWVQRGGGIAVMTATAIVVARRVRAAPPARRTVLGPLYVYGICAVLFVVLAINVIRPLFGFTIITAIVMQLVAVGLVPLAFALSMLRGGFARTTAVEELLRADAGQRPALRDALADALGDSSIRLTFWSDFGSVYVDEHGDQLVAPIANGDRGVVEIAVDDRRVGAIEYDATLIQEEELVRAAGRVVALQLDRERLIADLRAGREELRRSRVRIMQAADQERERIARDLHDGLQPRLLMLSLDAARAGVTEVQSSIDSMLDELRTLVYGVMSPVLIERGLYAATEDLADRLPIPVRLDVPAAPLRLPPSVEQAAFFVVSESLTNAVKHSQAHQLSIRLVPSEDRLHIEVADDGVGGATPTGVGLRGIADRVDVLGGRCSVNSPKGAGTRVVVEMPCAF